MKKLFIYTIIFYRIIISPLIKLLIGTSSMCRFTPSCSEYTKISIEKHGIVKGIKMGMLRILSCQPFSDNYKDLDIWMRFDPMK